MGFDRVVVFGAGTMGHGIAQVTAAAGYSVVLSDVDDARVQAGLARVKKSLDTGVEKGKVSAEDREWLRGYVRSEPGSNRNLERVLRDFFPRFDEVKATLLREEGGGTESADAGQQAG